jgi:hypothetical protein
MRYETDEDVRSLGSTGRVLDEDDAVTVVERFEPLRVAASAADPDVRANGAPVVLVLEDERAAPHITRDGAHAVFGEAGCDTLAL